DNGVIYFPTLVPQLRNRFWYDPVRTNLNVKGQWVDAIGVQEPKGYLLLNVISARESNRLWNLSSNPDYRQAVSALAQKASRVIELTTQPFDSLALTAGLAKGTGWVSFAENNSTTLNQPGDPVALH